jgi:hypothetical protein
MDYALAQGWLTPAQLFGYLAFALGVASFLQKSDRRFKWFMAGECLAYVVHFLLLGVPTAAASSGVSLVRSLLSLYTRARPGLPEGWLRSNLLLGWELATQWWNWLPLLASTIGTLALFLLHGIRMRVVMLGGTLLWIVNNVLSGSIGGTALELTILVVNCSTIWRLRAAAMQNVSGKSAPGRPKRI